MSNDKTYSVPHSLELDEDLSLHRKGKRVQHIGWVVMVVMLILGCIGMFGSGPVSYKTAKGQDAEIEYERFLRFEHELPIIVKGKGINGQMTVAFQSDYFEKFRVEQINPMPVDYQHRDQYVIYTFKVSEDEASIRFYFTPEGEGIAEGNVYVNQERFFLKHFIYP